MFPLLQYHKHAIWLDTSASYGMRPVRDHTGRPTIQNLGHISTAELVLVAVYTDETGHLRRNQGWLVRSDDLSK